MFATINHTTAQSFPPEITVEYGILTSGFVPSMQMRICFFMLLVHFRVSFRIQVKEGEGDGGWQNGVCNLYM